MRVRQSPHLIFVYTTLLAVRGKLLSPDYSLSLGEKSPQAVTLNGSEIIFTFLSLHLPKLLCAQVAAAQSISVSVIFCIVKVCGI